MANLQIFLVLLISLSAIHSVHRPRRNFKAAPKPALLPKDFDLTHYSALKIPNKEFCENQRLNPEAHFFVLPWWYYFCLDIKEKQEKERLRRKTIDLSEFSRILKAVHRYKLSRNNNQQL